MELSALDLHYLVKEWQFLVGGKLDQIYQPGSLVLRFHVSNTGKVMLQIDKHLIFQTEVKEESIQPPGFCMALRKRISNARVKVVEQVGFERIVHFVLEKEKTYHLYAELFAKGNIILTDAEHNVSLAALKIPSPYVPPQKTNVKALSEDEFIALLDDEEAVVKILARLGLGGFYAELVLDEQTKKQAGNAFSLDEKKAIYERVRALLDQPIAPKVTDERIIPFGGEEGSFAALFSERASTSLVEEIVKAKKSSAEKQQEKLLGIIDAQKKTLEKLEAESVENAKKGEFIYEHFQEIEAALLAAKKGEKHPNVVSRDNQKIIVEF